MQTRRLPNLERIYCGDRHWVSFQKKGAPKCATNSQEKYSNNLLGYFFDAGIGLTVNSFFVALPNP